MPTTKTFKIISKEQFNFTTKDGREFTKNRYHTDSDILEIFDDLEIGRSYVFDQTVAIDKTTGAEIKRKDGSPVYNWKVIDIVTETVNYDKSEVQLQLDEIFKKLDLLDKGIVEILEKLGGNMQED